MPVPAFNPRQYNSMIYVRYFVHFFFRPVRFFREKKMRKSHDQSHRPQHGFRKKIESFQQVEKKNNLKKLENYFYNYSRLRFTNRNFFNNILFFLSNILRRFTNKELHKIN